MVEDDDTVSAEAVDAPEEGDGLSGAWSLEARTKS